MFVLLKRCDLKTIRLKLTAIYILNVLDIVFTLILIKTGLFVEGNYFMVKMINNSALALVVKVVVVGALLAILYKRIEKATLKQLAISNVIVNSCMGIYVLINLSHMVWVAFSLFCYSTGRV